MLENDVGAMMNLLDLPANEKQLETRIGELEKQGASPAALRSLRQLHVSRSTKFEFGMADLQIIFAQLKGANPDLVTEGSFLGMKLYFEEKVRSRVEEVVKAERKKGSTEQEVRDAALVEAKKMLGGTSIASWRGRAFEGLLVDTFNNNPQLVATYGRMYQITQNNFPTYDIVGVKFSTGAGGVSAKNVATPLKFTLETVKANGKEIRVLVVLDANGKELVRQLPDGTITKHPHVEVWLSSLKAKDNAVITEMTKALGTPEKPTGQFMDVTPEYMESIDDKLDNARDRAKRAKASGDKSVLKDANKRIALLEFFKTKIRVNDDLTNARIDSLLRMLKGQGIDTNQIADDAVKKIQKKKGLEMPPFSLLKAGPARSRQEMAVYMGTVICPTCGEDGLVIFADDAIHDDDEVAVAHGKCALCRAYTDITFRAGPGWGTEPTDDLHLAVGDQPSVLLPESHFRAYAERAAERLHRSDPKNSSVMRAKAAPLIYNLLEVHKFCAARGEALDPESRKNLRAGVDVLISRGEPVPADVARALSDQKEA